MSFVILYISIGVMFAVMGLGLVYDSDVIQNFWNEGDYFTILYAYIFFFVVVMFTWPYWLYLFLAA